MPTDTTGNTVEETEAETEPEEEEEDVCLDVESQGELEFHEEHFKKLIYTVVELSVLQPLRVHISGVLRAATRRDDAIICANCVLFRAKPQSFFGIDPEFVSNSDWKSASYELSHMTTKTLPSELLRIVLDCAGLIYSTFSAERDYRVRTASKAETRAALQNSTLSGESFFPIFVYVLCQAGLTNMCFLKRYIWEFSPPEHLSGSAGYYMTVFEAACEYLLHYKMPSAEDMAAVAVDKVELDDAFARRGVSLEVLTGKIRIPPGQQQQQQQHKKKRHKKIVGTYCLVSIIDDVGTRQGNEYCTSLATNLTEPCFYSEFNFKRVQVRRRDHRQLHVRLFALDAKMQSKLLVLLKKRRRGGGKHAPPEREDYADIELLHADENELIGEVMLPLTRLAMHKNEWKTEKFSLVQDQFAEESNQPTAVAAAEQQHASIYLRYIYNAPKLSKNTTATTTTTTTTTTATATGELSSVAEEEVLPVVQPQPATPAVELSNSMSASADVSEVCFNLTDMLEDDSEDLYDDGFMSSDEELSVEPVSFDRNGLTHLRSQSSLKLKALTIVTHA
jgi:hypothetical protein